MQCGFRIACALLLGRLTVYDRLAIWVMRATDHGGEGVRGAADGDNHSQRHDAPGVDNARVVRESSEAEATSYDGGPSRKDAELLALRSL
jgi:hypothetical protein